MTGESKPDNKPKDPIRSDRELGIRGTISLFVLASSLNIVAGGTDSSVGAEDDPGETPTSTIGFLTEEPRLFDFELPTPTTPGQSAPTTTLRPVEILPEGVEAPTTSAASTTTSTTSTPATTAPAVAETAPVTTEDDIVVNGVSCSASSFILQSGMSIDPILRDCGVPIEFFVALNGHIGQDYPDDFNDLHPGTEIFLKDEFGL